MNVKTNLYALKILHVKTEMDRLHARVKQGSSKVETEIAMVHFGQ